MLAIRTSDGEKPNGIIALHQCIVTPSRISWEHYSYYPGDPAMRLSYLKRSPTSEPDRLLEQETMKNLALEKARQAAEAGRDLAARALDAISLAGGLSFDDLAIVSQGLDTTKSSTYLTTVSSLCLTPNHHHL